MDGAIGQALDAAVLPALQGHVGKRHRRHQGPTPARVATIRFDKLEKGLGRELPGIANHPPLSFLDGEGGCRHRRCIVELSRDDKTPVANR